MKPEVSIDRRSASLPDEPEKKPTVDIEKVLGPKGTQTFGTMTFRGVTVRELIPPHVLRWEDERQAAYYRGVMLRLHRQLLTNLALTLGEP